MGKRAPRTGLAFGRNRGTKVNTINKQDRRAKPSRRKGKLGTRTKMVREVIREMCGFTPYEKRILEILKVGDSKATKKAYRFAKVRLGTHKRALQKRGEIEAFLRIENQRQRERDEAERALRAKEEKKRKALEAAQKAAIKKAEEARGKKEGGDQFETEF